MVESPTSRRTMNDICIVGGGIIGLSLARELAGRGFRVRVLARERGARRLEVDAGRHDLPHRAEGL